MSNEGFNMKKILLCLLVFSVATLVVKSAEFSFSENGLGIKANVTREGQNLRLRYNLSGVDSLSGNAKIDEQQRQALSNIQNIDMDMLVSCKEPKIKIMSAQIQDKSSSSRSVAEDQTNWIPLTEQKDIQQLKELCSRY